MKQIYQMFLLLSTAYLVRCQNFEGLKILKIEKDTSFQRLKLQINVELDLF